MTQKAVTRRQAAILLLAADGLRLDDPVRKWLPTLPAAAGPVTLRHLPSHMGGLIPMATLRCAR